MDRDRAYLVAAFAAVLVRAARADLSVSASETGRMVSILAEFGGLTLEQARLAVDMATERSVANGISEDYLATREFKRVAGDEERQRLLHCLFAVAAADEEISLEEEEEIRQVASELGFEHREFTAVRSGFREHRSVLRGMPGRR
jgi:uncharacterized tellurite resistance protein B-like protein